MIVHTLKICTGDTGPEQSLVLLSLVVHPKLKCWLKKPTHGYIIKAKEVYIQLSFKRYKGKLSVAFLKSYSILFKRLGPEVIKLFSCSTQLSTKFILVIYVKMPTIVGILTFISMINTTSERF